MKPFNEIRKEINGQTLLSEVNLQTLYDTCKTVEILEGAAVEVGVYKGGSIKMIAQCLPDRPVYGFDTFEGISVITKEDDGIKHKIGDFAQDFEKVKEFLQTEKNVTLVKGSFSKTQTSLVQEKKICLVHIDTDAYIPAFEAMQSFWTRLVVGGIMLVHDFNWTNTPGIALAVNYFLERFRSDVTSISHCEIMNPPFISYYRMVKNA